MTPDLHPDAIRNLLSGDHGDPFALLGPHPAGEGEIAVRAFLPAAAALTLVDERDGARLPMTHLDEGGFFAVTLEAAWPPPPYHFVAQANDGREEMLHDPYRFGPLLTDYDRYLLSEGRHFTSYERLGAHLREVDGVRGVHFAVWAPNAYRVSVIGDFNGWDARVHPMRLHPDAGIWELFIPGLDEWTAYKYDLRTRTGGYQTQKTDPYGFAQEMRPRTASLVVDLDRYEWGDVTWMEARPARNPLRAPMSIYEVHLGSWRRKTGGLEWLTYRELAETLVPYVQEMGYTHIELMPVAEHALDMSWGYQVTGYFAATSRYGTPHDLMHLIDQCHQHGIGVIVDWVPAHFPKDGHALSYFDGTHLYEHADPRQGEHPHWGTYIFNYARNEVRNFLISNALFWLKKFHVDALRVDAVSSMIYLDFGREAGEWVPNEHGGNENLAAIRFLQEANAEIHSQCPGCLTIAEESTAWPMVSRPTYLGGLGFTLKWNMGWMHDTLDYIRREPIYRRWHHHQLTFSLMYAFSENFVLSLSHDEVVHMKGALISKIPGDWWQQFATLRLLLGYQATHPGKKLLFMGQEFGQWREWSEARSLDWHLVENFATHQGLQRWARALNRFYREQPALWQRDFDPAGFEWIEANDAEQSVYTYVRYAEDRADFLVMALNFTPVPRHDYRIGVPQPGYYRELLNSDASVYGGGNVGNLGGRPSDPIPWHRWSQSLSLTIPPLGMVVLKREGE
ncbi:MAG: 1,4-alpha-glucan branching protein GlgB [Anaerolineae bacterium]|nr:1,4-alpha-glucan branching protein GlgB [Anaerolineae bacterium]